MRQGNKAVELKQLEIVKRYIDSKAEDVFTSVNEFKTNLESDNTTFQENITSDINEAKNNFEDDLETFKQENTEFKTEVETSLSNYVHKSDGWSEYEPWYEAKLPYNGLYIIKLVEGTPRLDSEEYVCFITRTEAMSNKSTVCVFENPNGSHIISYLYTTVDLVGRFQTIKEIYPESQGGGLPIVGSASFTYTRENRDGNYHISYKKIG